MAEEVDNQLRSYLSIDLIFRKILIPLCSIALPLECFHFLVLAQKEMRSIAINILLMVICFCNLIQLLIRVPEDIKQIGDFERTTYCFSYDSYKAAMIGMITGIISGNALEIASLMTLLMSVFRAISVAYPMSSLTQKLSEVGYTIKIILISSLIRVFYSYYVRMLEYKVTLKTPGSYCALASNQSLAEPEQYRRELTMSYPYFTQIISGTEIIRSILQPVIHIGATRVLINELRETARRRKMLSSSNAQGNDNTTKLVTFMTIAYFCREIPLIIASLYLTIAAEDDRYTRGVLLAVSPLNILLVLDGASHFFICFFLSSQYKETVRAVLRIPKRTTTVWSAEQSGPVI